MRRLGITCALLAALVLGLSACASGPSSFRDLPSGDATRGSALFTQQLNGAPECSSCHTVDSSTLTGPSLRGFSTVAGTRVSGQSAQDYAYQSITQPSAFIVPGYGNLMYNQYAQRLNPQQLADLIAYILSL